MATEPKIPWWISRNSKGLQDGAWSIAWYTWLVWAYHAVLAPFAGSEFHGFGQKIVIGPFEWASITFVATAVLPYVLRKSSILNKYRFPNTPTTETPAPPADSTEG